MKMEKVGRSGRLSGGTTQFHPEGPGRKRPWPDRYRAESQGCSEATQALLEAVMDGKVPNEKDALLAFLGRKP